MEHSQYLYRGLHGHNALVPFAWISVLASFIAFVLFLVPATRKNFVTLNLGCLLIYAGVYIEKGMGLVVPGFTPSVLGEIYEYHPTETEVLVSAGIFGIGALLFTIGARVAIAVVNGDLVARQDTGQPAASPRDVEGAGV